MSIIAEAVGFVDVTLLPPAPGVTVPTIETRTFMLLDDDAQECRVIQQDELEASYVDNNITTFQLNDYSPADDTMLNNENVTFTYASGAQITIKLGLIDMNLALRAPQYVKRDGLIYPIDDSGNLMLNVVNTPNLYNIHKWYHDKAVEANNTDLKFAKIVYAFSEGSRRFPIWMVFSD